MDFYAAFYADAIRVAITRWLIEGTKISSEQFVKLIKNAIEGVAMYLMEEDSHGHFRIIASIHVKSA